MRSCYSAITADSLALVVDNATGEWLVPLTTVAQCIGYSRAAVSQWVKRGYVPKGVLNGKNHYFHADEAAAIVVYAHWCQRYHTRTQDVERRKRHKEGRYASLQRAGVHAAVSGQKESGSDGR